MSGGELQAWMERARALGVAHRDVVREEDHDPRTTLYDLHFLLLEAPTLQLRDAMRRFKERQLRDAAARQRLEVEDGRFGWAPDEPDAAPEAWAKAAYAQIRALDEHLAEGSHFFGYEALGPLPRGFAEGWRVPGRPGFLLPRGARRIRRTGGSPDSHPYSRRGLIHHALVPDNIDGVEIVPVPGPTTVSSKDVALGRAKFGAALFEGGKPDLAQTGRGKGDARSFIATGFEAVDVGRALAEHLRGVIEDACLVVVWPELAMPPESREYILDGLQVAKMGGREVGRDLRLLVMGSWHRQSGAGHVNSLEVFDRSGNKLLEQHKLLPYFDEENGEESIAPGNKIHVLVYEDFLVSFAVCKDYCEAALPNVFARLPVDLILVPSMGDWSTMEWHLHTSGVGRLVQGTSVFVVQQAVAHTETNFGFVLRTGDRTRSAEAQGAPPDLVQNCEWKAYG